MMWCALQWAERLLEGGGNEQWGDKWEERFKDGSGGKQVCNGTSSCSCGPSKYLSYWLLPEMLLLHDTAMLTL